MKLYPRDFLLWDGMRLSEGLSTFPATLATMPRDSPATFPRNMAQTGILRPAASRWGENGSKPPRNKVKRQNLARRAVAGWHDMSENRHIIGGFRGCWLGRSKRLQGALDLGVV